MTTTDLDDGRSPGSSTDTEEEPGAIQLPDPPELPRSADPCAVPADFGSLATSGGRQTYGFEFRGAHRPLLISISDQEVLTAGGVLVVMLHGAGLANEVSEVYWDDVFGAELSQHHPVAVVMAQADTEENSFWSQDDQFNADYLAALSAELDDAFCLDRLRTVLYGFDKEPWHRRRHTVPPRCRSTFFCSFRE